MPPSPQRHLLASVFLPLPIHARAESQGLCQADQPELPLGATGEVTGMPRQRAEGASEAGSLHCGQGCPFSWFLGVNGLKLGRVIQHLRCLARACRQQVGGAGSSSPSSATSATQCWLWVEVGKPCLGGGLLAQSVPRHSLLGHGVWLWVS